MKDLETASAREHSQNIKSELQKIADHIRRDAEKVDDLQAKTLFETSAEVLEGLITAFSQFEEKGEEVW